MIPTDLANLMFFIIGGAVLIALVAIVGGFLHTRRERLLTHQERMKALELGREMPDDAAAARIKAAFGIASGGGEGGDGEGSLAGKCFSTTFWVAFWGFLAVSGAVGHVTRSEGPGTQIVAIAIAAAVGAIGVAGMICGTILALRAPAAPTSMTASATRAKGAPVDPDGP